jgi:hypothetical protein
VLIGLRTRELLQQFLEARCRLPPVVTVIEDLHWIVALPPMNLARDHRAVFEGRVPEAHLAGHVRALIRRVFKADQNPWGDLSLDTVISGTDILRINTVSKGLWG